MLALVLFSIAASAQPVSSTAQVQVVRQWMLDKTSGRIDEALLLADGRFAIRDANFAEETTQAIEIFDSKGAFVRKIGKFGRGSGEYYRLKDIDSLPDSSIVAVDVLSRITWFSISGEVLRTKLIQEPGYYPSEIQIDDRLGRLFVSGCKAQNYYLDQGCMLLHLYEGDDYHYSRSFWETESEAVEKRYFSLEDYFIDLDPKGRIVACDAPIPRLFRIDSDSGRVEAFPLVSDLMTPVAPLDPTNSEATARIYRSSYLIRKVVATADFIVVSLACREKNDSRLAVFDTDGHQIGMDIPVAGLLVGKTPSGTLLIATPSDGRFKLWEGKVDAKNRP